MHLDEVYAEGEYPAVLCVTDSLLSELSTIHLFSAAIPGH
jgi:hypothetical protein